MFAALMDGMYAQRDKNTANRRASAKLFNEHLKNAKDLGLNLTEEGLTEAWYENSGGVMSKYAPSQSRLQGIVEAQNKSLAEKQAVADIKAMEQQRTVRSFNETDLNKRFGMNAGNIPDDAFYQSYIESLGGNQVMIDDANAYTGNGNNLAGMQSAYERTAVDKNTATVSGLIALGVTDISALQFAAPDMPASVIKEMLARGAEDRGQVTKGWKQSDVIYKEDRLTFQNQQITFKRNEQESIAASARLIVENQYKDKFNTMTLTEKEAAIATAKEAVIRKVILDQQSDIKFDQGQLTYEFDFNAAIKSAERQVIKDGQNDEDRNTKITSDEVKAAQQVKVFNQDQAMLQSKYIERAKVQIDQSTNLGTATRESITEILNTYEVTDPATINRIWEESKIVMERATDKEMIDQRSGNVIKRANQELKIEKAMIATKKDNNENILNFFGEKNQNVLTALTVIANRYEIVKDEIGYFSDWVNTQVDSGAWKDAPNQSIIDSMDEELQAPTSGMRKPRTYASQKQALIAQSIRIIGVDQYTPQAFQSIYIPKVDDEMQAHLRTMEVAVENKDEKRFIIAKGAITSLAMETQADLSVRGEDFKTAFGSRSTQQEADDAIISMNALIEKSISASTIMIKPVAKITKVSNYPFRDELFVKMGAGDLNTIEDGVSIANQFIKKDEYKNGAPEMIARRDSLLQAQQQFSQLLREYDEQKNLLDNETDASQKRMMRAEIDQIRKAIIALQVSTASAMKSLQQY